MREEDSAGNNTVGHDVEENTDKDDFFAEFEERHTYPREDFEAVGEAFARREIEGYDATEETVTVYGGKVKILE